MSNTMTNKYYIHTIKPIDSIDGFVFLELQNIDQIPEDTVEAIYIHDLLDYISENSVNKTIRILRSKLKEGGKLYIQGTDIKSASVSMLHGQITTKLFKSMIYGLGKISTYTISDVREILQNINGLKIIAINYINASQYYIECLKYE